MRAQEHSRTYRDFDLAREIDPAEMEALERAGLVDQPQPRSGRKTPMAGISIPAMPDELRPPPSAAAAPRSTRATASSSATPALSTMAGRR